MKKKWYIPLLIIVLFGIESIFTNFFPSVLNGNVLIFVPRFLFIYLIFLTVYYDKKSALLYALLIGLIMDMVFTGIYGLYLFWYPVLVFLTSKVMKNWHSNLFIMAIVNLIILVLLESGLFLFNFILQIADLTFEYFLYHRLLPTLAVNLVFFIFLSYPLKKYLTELRKTKEEEEGMFQS